MKVKSKEDLPASLYQLILSMSRGDYLSLSPSVVLLAGGTMYSFLLPGELNES
jgi:hypothetical protein